MATACLRADPAQFHMIMTNCLAASQIRRDAHTDREVEEGDRIAAPLFETLIETPAPTPGMIVAKGELLLKEYGETGLVERELVEALIEDVRRLTQ